MDSQVHYLPLTPAFFSILVFLAAGLIILGITLYDMSGWTPDISGNRVMLTMIVQGFSMGWIWNPITVLSFTTLPAHLRGDATELVKAIVLVVAALFPIVNPVGSAAIFIDMTGPISAPLRDLLARKISTFSFLLLIGSMLFGARILSFFGVSLYAVQIGGGLVVAATGWSLLKPEYGGARPDICAQLGQFIPFANTNTERLSASDPRPSIEERYANQGAYVRAVDDAAAALREHDPVALSPDPGERLEVRAPVERPVRVSPQLDGHRRHRPRDDELAEPVDERLAVGVEGIRGDAEQPSRDLALVFQIDPSMIGERPGR